MEPQAAEPLSQLRTERGWQRQAMFRKAGHAGSSAALQVQGHILQHQFVSRRWPVASPANLPPPASNPQSPGSTFVPPPEAVGAHGAPGGAGEGVHGSCPRPCALPGYL